MTASAGAPLAGYSNWDSVNWSHVEKKVKRLQMRIAKAIKEGRFGKAKSLQWILTHSYYAKLLAVRKVTSNKGAKTPGVDKVKWRTGNQKLKAVQTLKRKGYKPQPLRRVYIPKANGKKRGLGIPTMKCRAMQALHLLALEPVSETLSDKHSYGFRRHRSCADAIEQCFVLFSRKHSSKFALEGDIKSCLHSKTINGNLQEIYTAFWFLNLVRIAGNEACQNVMNPEETTYKKPNFKLFIHYVCRCFNELWTKF